MFMSTPTPTDDLAARVRTMQIIGGAMLLGAAAFLIIAVVQRPTSDDVKATTLTYAALAGAVVIAVVYHFAVDTAERTLRRRLATTPGGASRSAWYGAYQTSTIVGLAVLEAGALLMLLAYWVEPVWHTRLAAIGFMAIMVTNLPTAGRIERWINEQQEALRRDQSGR
jgi:hypothetical protein